MQTFIGIPWYDSQARYQNTEGLLSGIDPLCEQHYSLSPYAYAACNPVNCVDPDGKDIILTGANGSSVVIFTSVVNRNIDLSRTGIDFEDNLYFYGIDAARDFFDLAGIIDPSPICDCISAILSAYDRDYSAALLSVVSIFPIGDVVKVKKASKLKDLYFYITHSHHLIPKAVYRRFEDLTGVLKRDGKMNRMDLPAGFHGNHPQYSEWVARKLDDINKKREQSFISFERGKSNRRSKNRNR